MSYTLAIPCFLFPPPVAKPWLEWKTKPAPMLPTQKPSEAALHCCTHFHCMDQVFTKAVLVHQLNSPAASGHSWPAMDNAFGASLDDYLPICPVPLVVSCHSFRSCIAPSSLVFFTYIHCVAPPRCCTRLLAHCALIIRLFYFQFTFVTSLAGILFPHAFS